MKILKERTRENIISSHFLQATKKKRRNRFRCHFKLEREFLFKNFRKWKIMVRLVKIVQMTGKYNDDELCHRQGTKTVGDFMCDNCGALNSCKFLVLFLHFIELE